VQIALPELSIPATLVLDRENRLSDDEYFAFWEANPDLRLERTAQGEIVIVPPAGLESDHRNFDLNIQFGVWSKANRRGEAFGPTAQFPLPDGSALSPDTAWVSNDRLATIPIAQRKGFPRVVPEFVAEVISPSDRPKAAHRKMQQWIDNGVDLAWLIDGDNQCVYVYRQNCEMRLVRGVSQIEGEGPIDGFVLDLTDIWAGL
jgi:Uma2 family endonuclease